MKTNNIKRSMAITIALATVLSIGFFALPVSALTPVVVTPSDTIISVQQGQTFLVRQTITFNNPAFGGYLAIALAWDTSARWDNYTLENEAAYWTSGGSGVGNPVENLSFGGGATLTGWQVTASIPSGLKNYYDGTFNVDFWLRAANQEAAHKVALENNLSYGTGINATEQTLNLVAEENVAVNTTAWNGGVIVNGISPNAYSQDVNPPVEMVNYPPGSTPPIIAATKRGSGVVIAANIAPALRNGANGFEDVGNLHRTLDSLLDSIIQWAKPGAMNIAWSGAAPYFVYSAEKVPLRVTDNMIAKWGYSIILDNRVIENINDNYGWKGYDNTTPIDVFVIPEYEPGLGNVGGDPTLIPNAAVADLNTWVNNGGVLIVIDCADYSPGICYNRVQNKILAGVGSNWWMNNDSLYDNVDNYNANYHYYSNVASTTAVGGAFGSFTGSQLVGMYSPSTLIPAATFGSTLTVTPPLEQLTDNTGTITNTFTVTEFNTSSVADTFTMNLSQDILPAWTLSWPLVATTNYYTATADAMVDNNNPGTNYGTANTENLAGATDNREIFLRFNLGAIPASSISAAYLVMSYYPVLTTQFYGDAMSVSDNTWTEAGINWSNMPAVGSILDTQDLVRANGPPGGPAGAYFTTWNVTSWIVSNFPGPNVSIAVRANDNTPSGINAAVFDSREYSTTTYRPVLVVTYIPTPYTTISVNVPAGGSVSKTFTVKALAGISSGAQDNITITATELYDTLTEIAHSDVRAKFGYSVDENVAPASQTVPILTTATIFENLYNTGSNTDNLIENVYDSLGWISPINQVFLNVPAGGMVPVTISVPVPVTIGLTDTITKKVTSQNDPAATVTKTVTVTSGPSNALVLPYSTITGNTLAHVTSVGNTLINPAYSYDPLTLTVAVYNLGKLDDKYLLTAYADDNTVGLKLTPDEVFVPSGDVAYVALSVTLPSSWVGGQTTIVHVLENGQMSTENQLNLYPTYLENIQVTADNVHNVAKNIMPDTAEPQTGAPGSPLVWLIAVKNTGNVPENLSLAILSESVTGVSTPPGSRTGWDNTRLDNLNWGIVGVGKTVITYLRTWVPADAKTSEWDNITIQASDGLGATDTEWVMAHVVQPGPRIPEGQIEISVEAQIISIEVWPNTWNFGVMDEDKIRETSDNYFTVRNTGNIAENILIRGSDAKSMPGEPVATWTLSDVSIGLNQYMMTVLGPVLNLSKTNKFLTTLSEGSESSFGLKIQAPSAITTPARMWARIYLTAVAAVPPS